MAKKKAATKKATRKTAKGRYFREGTPSRRERVKKAEPDVRAAFRLNLRNRRVELGLSQRQLGEQVGVVQQWIGQLEAPARDEVPSLYQLEDLARILKCSTHDLLIPGRFNSGVSVDEDMRKYQHRTR